MLFDSDSDCDSDSDEACPQANHSRRWKLLHIRRIATKDAPYVIRCTTTATHSRRVSPRHLRIVEEHHRGLDGSSPSIRIEAHLLRQFSGVEDMSGTNIVRGNGHGHLVRKRQALEIIHQLTQVPAARLCGFVGVVRILDTQFLPGERHELK